MSARVGLAWVAVAVGIAAVVGLAAGVYSSVALLGSALRSGLAEPPPSEVRAPPGPIAPSHPVDVPPSLPPPAPLPDSERPEQVAQLLPPPRPGTWEATPIAARGRALGRAGLDLEQGLVDVQDTLSACFTQAVQAGYSGKPVLEVGRREIDDSGSTVVVLQVEATGGELRIDDAPLEVRAGASDATIACVQERLRTVRVPSESRPPAPRFRLRFAVTP